MGEPNIREGNLDKVTIKPLSKLMNNEDPFDTTFKKAVK